MNPLLNHPGYLIQTPQQAYSLDTYLVKRMGHAYQQFCASWDKLLPDPYLRDGGHYRLRRYSVFNWQSGRLTLLPHEPHYQSGYHNKLHGGFNRHFRPWLPTTIQNPALLEMIRWCVKQFSRSSTQLWRIQAHQFRIRTSAKEQGKPTPEGVHKDGADYILIMMINRQNISGGQSLIYDNQRQALEAYTLEQRGDLMLVNDQKIYHGVTPVTPTVPNQVAWRDVLVLTFHRFKKQ